MALSTFSGRLRNRPDGVQFSASPISLPNGVITVHSPYCKEAKGNGNDVMKQSSTKSVNDVSVEKSILKTPLRIFNLMEVNYTCFECVVDHRWTSITVESEGDKKEHTILAVLSRPIQYPRTINTAVSESIDGSLGKLSGSVVKLFRFENNRPDGTWKSSSGQELVSTVHLNSFCNCLAMDKRVLVVGGGNGILIYTLKGLLNDIIFSDENQSLSYSLDEFNLMPSHPVLALSINSTYLVSASVDSLRVWNVDQILEYMQNPATNLGITEDSFFSVPGALWCSKLNLERITCIEMTTDCEFLSVSCWDGKVLVFRAERTEIVEDKLSSSSNDITSWAPHNPESSWETPCQCGIEPYYPTFLTLYYEKDMFAMLAVTTPGSSIVRIFDLISGQLYDELNCVEAESEVAVSNDITVQGLILTDNTGKTQEMTLVWIDSNDTIYQSALPQLPGV